MSFSNETELREKIRAVFRGKPVERVELFGSRCPWRNDSLTSRLISWRLRRFRTQTSSISVMPTVHQKHAASARWVALTDALQTMSSGWNQPPWSDPEDDSTR